MPRFEIPTVSGVGLALPTTAVSATASGARRTAGAGGGGGGGPGGGGGLKLVSGSDVPQPARPVPIVATATNSIVMQLNPHRRTLETVATELTKAFPLPGHHKDDQQSDGRTSASGSRLGTTMHYLRRRG